MQDQKTRHNGMSLLLLLALHRIIQRWNQTGQKFAGAPDIVQDILRPNPTWLWLLVTATYLFLLSRIGNHIVHDLKSGAALGTACSLALVVPAFFFKLAFTANDAPELLSWLGADVVHSLERIPLVGSARVVFLTLASETLWAFSAAANAEKPRVAKTRKWSLFSSSDGFACANDMLQDSLDSSCPS
jgi:ethanolaminephosphotransferase